MAIFSSTLRGRVLKFHSAALEPNTLLVLSVEGTESISAPYRFELELVSSNGEIDSAALLKHPAYLGLKQGVTLRGGTGRGVRNLKIHGVLSSFSQGEKGGGWIVYRAVLVPKLWRTSLGAGSRIFLNKTAPQIVEEVLKGNGFTSQDYELKLGARDYPKREYVAQYQETDFNFASRLCEQEGIFYFFKQEEEGEKVVFADSTEAYEPLGGEDAVLFRPASANGAGKGGPSLWLEQESVQEISLHHTPLPKEVVLRDYNYRTPSVDLKVSAPVGDEGVGTVFLYGDHYADAAEGRALAGVRAEELRCRERIFRGSGTVRSFRSGLTYELAEHYRGDWNRRYVITEVRHKAVQSMTVGSLADVVSSYRNEFACIPADRVFRPERLTPKPRISGTINAKVDAAGSGEYAEIDDQGRYKVQFPFDLSGRSNGTASGYVRMAQPYAGPNGMGMHFPLHKGTEVILTHIDGDPDRPIIASAVPNPETAGPVAGGNQSQCAITTGGGSKLVIEDTAGGQQIALSCPKENTSFHMGDGCIGMKTDGPHDEYCKGLRTTHAVAGEKHSTDGPHEQTIKGRLLKTVHGPSMSNYYGAKVQNVAGVQSYNIGGAFTEVVVGAIVHTGLAYQIHRTAGPHKLHAPLAHIEGPVAVKIDSHGKIEMHAPRISGTGTAAIDLKGGGTTATLDKVGFTLGSAGKIQATAPRDILLDGKPIQITSGGDILIGASGTTKVSGKPLHLESSGDVTIKGKNIDVDASSFKVNGSIVEVTKSSLKVKGSTLEIS